MRPANVDAGLHVWTGHALRRLHGNHKEAGRKNDSIRKCPRSWANLATFGKGISLFRTKVVLVASLITALITLGMTTASAGAVAHDTNTIPSIQPAAIACTSTTCVITGANVTTGGASTALLNPSTGAIKLGPSNGYFVYDTGLACPNKTTCIGLGEHNFVETTVDISPRSGAQKVVSNISMTSRISTLFGIACLGSEYCLVYGDTSPFGGSAFLAKVSPTGKILKRTVDKSYEQYADIACESARTCLVAREVKNSTYQSVTMASGEFGKKPYGYPKNYMPLYSSCYSYKLCYSSGITGNTLSPNPQVTSLNPKTGAPGKAFNLPLADTENVELGIACYSSTQCVVVGEVAKGKGSNQTTYAAYVIITKGRIGKPVLVSTSKGSSLITVSCASPQECYAIGSYFDSTTDNSVTLIAKV